ncbi:hypothetical protein ACIA98_43035 [Streptomyces sp. NPDC051366]|uniref:hypothetical protein n=1 Tax=Streptomyces sp. NPDC051366 TaxID=3365652 RepID=UPI0037A22E54
MLDAIRSDIRRYAPGTIAPDLAQDGTYGLASLDAELHQVATTPTDVVARQLEVS